MVRGRIEGDFTALTPRQVVDGIDWPQFVVLYLDAPERSGQQPSTNGTAPQLHPGERVMSAAEFGQALARRAQARQERGEAAPVPGIPKEEFLARLAQERARQAHGKESIPAAVRGR